MSWQAELPCLLPALLLNPLLYWHGYHCWFQQDDFAWLGLLQMLDHGYDLPRLLLEPMAQGTIRPLSERAFFLVFRWLFDLNAAPYHARVLVTQTANLVLLFALVRRLASNSAVAGLAALLWCSNSVLSWPLAWVSAYNQILISCCFLASATAFVRYAETGRRRWLALAWAVYLTGFGVLESNVVFPALALLYTLLWAPRVWRSAAGMFIPALVYTELHHVAAPKPSSGVYTMDFGFSHLPGALARYWTWAVWPAESAAVTGLPSEAALIPAAAVAVAVAWRLVRRDRLAVFGLGWFLASLSVYLVLPNHISEYYLTVPAIGLAMALAATVHAAPRVLAATLLILILPVSWLGAWRFTERARTRSTAWRVIMEGVSQASRGYPGRAIYLEGLGADVFAHGFTDSPFRLITATSVKLTPHEAADVAAAGWAGSLALHTTAGGLALRAIDSGQAMVFRLDGGRLIESSLEYRARLGASALATEQPDRIELGNPLYEYLLGPGWYDAEAGYRWMSKSASASVGSCSRARQRLHVRGFCAPRQLERGPIRLEVRVDGAAPPASLSIDSCSGPFDFAMPLPAILQGSASIDIELAVDRAFAMPPDRRELGLAIETIEIR